MIYILEQSIEIFVVLWYILYSLQGKVKFLTGGNREDLSPRADRPIRCDPGTDSTVWMKEDHFCYLCPDTVPGFFIGETAMNKQKYSTRYIAVVAMFTAISYIAVLISKVIPNVAGFLSYEPKDAVIVIAGFIFGPLTCVFVSVLTSLIEMLTISSTGVYGLLMNVVSTCSFTVPAAWYYRKHHTLKGAVIGLGIGIVVLAACMVLWNYIITPFYMGVDRSVVAGMLMSIFLPFNLIKGGINAGITLLIYKPVVNALRRAHLVEESSSGNKGGFKAGFTIFAVAVLITFVLLFLVMIGVL